MADYSELRKELEAVLRAEVDRCGVGGVDKSKIVQPFLGRGPARSGLYRWVDAYLSSSEPRTRLRAKARKAASKRAKREPTPAAASAAVAVKIAEMVEPIRIERVAGGGAVPFVDELTTCIAVVKDVLAHARHEDGKLKLPKMTLAAVREMRGLLVVAARWQEAQAEQEKLELFHQAVFDVVAQEDPRVAERILVRLRQLNATWSAPT